MQAMRIRDPHAWLMVNVKGSKEENREIGLALIAYFLLLSPPFLALAFSRSFASRACSASRLNLSRVP